MREYVESDKIIYHSVETDKNATAYQRSDSPLMTRMLHLQRTVGNRTVQRLVRSGRIHAKPMHGILNDTAAEQEAERVAGNVVNASMVENVSPVSLQRQPTAENLITQIQESVTQTLSQSGQPLDDSTRRFMESRFAQDFSGVRVHTGEAAAQSAADINAHAFTAGNQIVFGTGEYKPETESGKHLLAHELTHVVQQGMMSVSPGQQTRSTNPINRQPKEVEQPVAPKRIKASSVLLDFVPDEIFAPDADNMLSVAGLIHVYVNGKEVTRYPARGGPPVKDKDENGLTRSPTKSGKFKLAQGVSHKSGFWPFSQMVWGTPIREVNTPRGKDAQYFDGTSWKSTRRLPIQITYDDILNAEVDAGRAKALPTASGWDLNDFGKISFHVHGTNEFIHTVPNNEEQFANKQEEILDFSHGCIHIKPSDRDEMIQMGYLQGGVTLKVHNYRKENEWGTPP